jgi:hypothetical protein
MDLRNFIFSECLAGGKSGFKWHSRGCPLEDDIKRTAISGIVHIATPIEPIYKHISKNTYR